jgi:co-chaperonin GroES (HSP10)
MPPPKSQKLLREESAAAEREADRRQAEREATVKVYKPGEEIPVKKVRTFNDFVAILQFRVESSILMTGNHGYKNEGMVVGVGPGLPGSDGKRVPSQLQIGDVVSFYGNPTTALEPKSGVYAGQKIIIVPERAVICGLKAVPFKIVEDEPAQE